MRRSIWSRYGQRGEKKKRGKGKKYLHRGKEKEGEGGGEDRASVCSALDMFYLPTAFLLLRAADLPCGEKERGGGEIRGRERRREDAQRDP